ncbi:MAG TPA: hypothetical protein DCM35_04285 [Alcanivorax sp.]|jgi:hypothetical protein|nr:hypothetical protein [Alcanivorax sp.]
MQGFTALLFEFLAAIGGGVVIGLMAFGFFGVRIGAIAGVIAFLATAWFGFHFLRDYTVLMASLTAYGVSTLVCVAISLASNQRFDFDEIGRRVNNYDNQDPADLPEGAATAK